jgi:putative protease
MVRILSPVSSYEAAAKVISAGADEIYCGVGIPNIKYPGLSLRQRMCSISTYDELGKVTKHAHDHGVKVVVTTELPFISDTLREDIEKHISSCVDNGVDAIIATDIGIILAAKSMGLAVPIYASTYNASMNYEAVNFLRSLGVKRVILERQVAIEEMQEIVRRCKGVEVEVFVHGPGCSNINTSCYGCYIPPSLLGASARVKLAFKLRKPAYKHYVSWVNEDKALIIFSPTCRLIYGVKKVNSEKNEVVYAPILDAYTYCSMCRLPILVKTGVTGFKIIGRCKSQKYQEGVTKAYRELLDLIEEGRIKEFRKKLRKIRSEMGEWSRFESPGGIDFNPCEEERCFYSPFFYAPYKSLTGKTS